MAVVRILLVLMVLVVLGCKKEKAPADVLSHNEMVKVLTDIYVMEDRVSRLGLKRDSASKVFGVMKEKVFEHKGVSDSLVRKSMDYYMDHPQELELIYTALVDSLNLKEQRQTFRPDEK